MDPDAPRPNLTTEHAPALTPFPGPPPPETGPTLPRVPDDRFTSFVPLGQGGMGIVYQAYDTLLAREVAFKVARPDGGTGPEGVTPPSPLTLRAADDAPARAAIDALRARFLHEACLTSGLEHPAIAPVYDVGETAGGLPYYTMRLVPGHRTLADAIAATRDAPFGARAPLLEPVARVADAVAFAHARGVVHRDLKPSNIALGEFGEVVVLDWGLARARARGDAPPADARNGLADLGPRLGLRTAAGWLGTPGWVAPEAWDARPAADPERADVFALGTVLFEVLTGRLPWPADDASTFVAAVTAGPAPRADVVAPSVPADLATLAARALERDPQHRLATAADVARGVRAWSQRSAAEAERTARLADVTAALDRADGSGAGLASRELDRVAATLATLPDHDADAATQRARLDVARAAAREAAVGSARRATTRRVAVIGGAVLAVGAALAAVLVEGRRRDAVAAREVATAEHARAEAGMQFMLFDLRERLEPIGRLDLLAAVADRALAHYREAGAGPVAAQEALGRAVALRTIGDVYEARGDLPNARTSYEAGEAATRSAVEPTPALALEAAIARARVGAVIDATGRRGEALAVFRRHVEELDAMAAARPTTEGLAAARARAWVRLARALVRQDDVAGARRAAARAVEVAEANLAATPHDAEARDLALETALESAQAAAWTADWARAAAEATAAYERAGALAAEDPSDARWPRRRAEAITRAVVPLARTGRADDARRLYEEGQRLLARASEADPADERWRERSVVLAIRMADAWAVTGRPPTAFAELSAALDTAERLAARDATNAQRIHLLVDLTDRRSGERAARGDVTGALADRRANVAHAERLVERDPANAVWRRIRTHSRQRLAEAYEAVGDAPAAREAYARAAAWAADLALGAPTDWALRFAACGSALGEGRNRVRAGERAEGLATMRAALRAFDAAAAAFPSSELPYRAAQARAELAETLRREDAAERAEAVALLESAIAWARAAEAARTDAGAARFRAELEARLERLRIG